MKKNFQGEPFTGTGLSLRALLPQARPLGADDFVLKSCCGSWQDCRPHDLFVAIEGPFEDGHDFAHQAVARGATAVLCERLLAVNVPQFLVEDSRIAYGMLCHALSGRPSRALRVVGVAGTDGKTVTSLLAQSILSSAGYRVSAATSLRSEDDMWPGEDTPVPNNCPSIAHWLASAAADQHTHAVLEISSLSLAQHSLAGMELDLTVLGNIRRDHLTFHGTESNYRDVQSRVLRYLKPNGMVILNVDDPYARQFLDTMEFPALTVGLQSEAAVSAQLLDRDPTQQTFLLTAGGDTAVVCTRMIGQHHLYNCLAATAIGLACGVELPTIVAGIESLGQLPNRLELLSEIESIQVWLDCARSNTQLAAALHTVGQLANGRLWAVATVAEEGSDEQRRRLGALLERAADQVILTQSSSGSCFDYEPFHQVLDGCSRPEAVAVIPNRMRAIHWAMAHASRGDTVLVAGGGGCVLQSVDPVSRVMTDREICLAGIAAAAGDGGFGLEDGLSTLPDGD